MTTGTEGRNPPGPVASFPRVYGYKYSGSISSLEDSSSVQGGDTPKYLCMSSASFRSASASLLRKIGEAASCSADIELIRNPNPHTSGDACSVSSASVTED